MPLIPSRLLVLLSFAALVLAMGAALELALLWPLALVNLALLAAALIDSWSVRLPLVTVTRNLPRILSIGRKNPVRLTVTSQAGRFLTVTVQDDLPDAIITDELPVQVAVAPGGTVPVTYHVRPVRRGSHGVGDLHVRYGSRWGLWTRQIRVPFPQQVRVYPDLQAVRTYELLARQNRETAWLRTMRLRGGENEFERLRDYRRDDEYRNIDWKATARRQKLIARDYQQERNQTVICLVDCGRLMTAQSGGMDHLDRALNAVLMMAHVATRSGDRVGLLAYDSHIRAYVAPVGGREAARQMIHATYDLHAALVEPDPQLACQQVAQRFRKRALVVLFTQIIDEVAAQELLRAITLLTPNHLPLCVVFRDDEVDDLASARRAPTDIDLYIQGAAAEILDGRERWVRELKARGALVLHTSPRLVTPALINRYLEIKAQQRL